MAEKKIPGDQDLSNEISQIIFNNRYFRFFCTPFANVVYWFILDVFFVNFCRNVVPIEIERRKAPAHRGSCIHVTVREIRLRTCHVYIGQNREYVTHVQEKKKCECKCNLSKHCCGIVHRRNKLKLHIMPTFRFAVIDFTLGTFMY